MLLGALSDIRSARVAWRSLSVEIRPAGSRRRLTDYFTDEVGLIFSSALDNTDRSL
jgi:hypothetical protein